MKDYKVIQVLPADQSFCPKSVFTDIERKEVFRIPIMFFAVLQDKEGNTSISPVSYSGDYMEPDIYMSCYRGFEIKDHELADDLVLKNSKLDDQLKEKYNVDE